MIKALGPVDGLGQHHLPVLAGRGGIPGVPLARGDEQDIIRVLVHHCVSAETHRLQRMAISSRNSEILSTAARVNRSVASNVAKDVASPAKKWRSRVGGRTSFTMISANSGSDAKGTMVSSAIKSPRAPARAMVAIVAIDDHLIVAPAAQILQEVRK